MDELCTARLLLRRFRSGDAAAFAAVNADPLVTRYLGDGRPLGRAESDRLLGRIAAHWDEHGFGLWAAELRGDGRLIGFVGLAVPTFLPAVLPAVEVGWRLASDVWGRGLATEGGRAALEHGFGTLRLDRIVSIIDPRNAASLRVAGKLGLRWERTEVHPGTLRPVHVYAAAAAASMAGG
jgi:RimJ/RimL family protein N-acetyltransferase